ncbi:uncharacterized protein LOC131260561 [Anopheles coustani]|uniref:uncharacterized protein LOC131260561 n=1 Tax=Anopheles coustani TaxID=139045 RepID=UPI00265A6D68|nr:uncharacterized protein LOC131260561 [Anopheles coustani]
MADKSGAPILPTKAAEDVDMVGAEEVELNQEMRYILVDDTCCLNDDPSRSVSRSSSETDEDERPLQEQLGSWVKSSGLTQDKLNELLDIIHQKTTADVARANGVSLIEHTGIEDGQIWYPGVQKTLQWYFRHARPTVDVLEIDLSLEAVTMHSKDNAGLWPILVQVLSLPEKPILVVGIFYGSPLPANCESFLRPLVSELNRLFETGVPISFTIPFLHRRENTFQKFVPIRLRSIIADAPARAFMNGIAYSNAARQCYKCTSIGKFIKEDVKVILPGVKGVQRTAEQFRNRAYGANYTPSTPLLDLARFNLIEDVVIGDEFGVMRKLLKGYVENDMEPTYPGWSEELEKRMSRKLCAIKFPSEVGRTLRPFKYAPYWSGPELHTFLYHASMAVLKDKMEPNVYQHFTLYYCGMTLLSSKVYKKHWEYAGKLLEKFVQQFDEVYKSHLTNTVHNLLHYAPEVLKFGPNNRYAFQSKLRHIRGIAYTVRKPLEKVVRKLVEESALEAVCEDSDDDEFEQPEYPRIVVSQEEGVVLQVNANFMLQRGVRDGWFLTKENVIVYYTTASVQDERIVIQGRPMVKQSPTFSYPRSSAIIQNFKASASDLSSNAISVKLPDIKCKLAAAITNKERRDIYFSPVLQTLGHDTIKLEALLKSMADEKQKQPKQAAQQK